jgi:hypothetical protein
MMTEGSAKWGEEKENGPGPSTSRENDDVGVNLKFDT